MARVPKNSYGQSRYTDQLLQTVLTPTTTSGTLGFSVGTNLTVSSIAVGTISAANIFSPNFVVGDLRTGVLNIGCQSLQGTYTCNVSSTIVGVRAVGNTNVRGTFTNNVIVGAETGLNLCNTDFSVYVGAGAGTFGQGQSNTVVGYGAAIGSGGIPVTRGNVILGAGAGISNAGNSNVFIGVNAGADISTNSNLFIVNTRATSSNALLYGRFDTGQLGINCIPGVSVALHVSGGSMRVERDLIVDGNILASTISADINASNISGIAPNLRGSGNGIFGGVGLSGAISIFNTTASVVGLIESSNGNGVITLCNAARTSKMTLDGSGGAIRATTLVLSNGPLTVCNATKTTIMLPDVLVINDLSAGTSIRQGAAGIALCNLAGNVFNVAVETGNITNPSSSSNYIGGVWLLSNTISTSVISSSFIGGVNISNRNIGTTGTINAGASTIGFVNISNGINTQNNNITTGNGGFNCSYDAVNKFGDLTISRNIITAAMGAINMGGGCSLGGVGFSGGAVVTGLNSTCSIGGVILVSCNINTSGSITTACNVCNVIGGVVLQNGTITGNIQGGAGSSYDGNSISNLTIPGGKLSNNTITSNQIANGTITATQIANGTITATQISNNTITSNQIQTNTITGAYLTSDLSLRGITDAVIVNQSTTSNFIGGVYLHNSNLSLGGNISNRYGTSNYIGGITIEDSLVKGAQLFNFTVNTDISMFTDSVGNVGMLARRDGNGQVNLLLRSCNTAGNPSVTTVNTLTLDYEGNLKAPGRINTLFGRISAGNLEGGTGGCTVLNPNNIQVTSNNSNRFLLETNGNFSACNLNPLATFTLKADTGNISNLSSSSNYIGGVTLSGGIIINASNSSNSIGGVRLSNGVISNPSNSSNNIGGVQLLNGYASKAYTIKMGSLYGRTLPPLNYQDFYFPTGFWLFVSTLQGSSAQAVNTLIAIDSFDIYTNPTGSTSSELTSIPGANNVRLNNYSGNGLRYSVFKIAELD